MDLVPTSAHFRTHRLATLPGRVGRGAADRPLSCLDKEGNSIKKVLFEQVLLGAIISLLLLPAMIFARAVRHDKEAVPADNILVIGHIALPNASVTSLKTSAHRRRQFLELQDTQHRTLILVDVTNAARPAVVKQFHLPSEPADCTLAALDGDVALVTDTQPPAVHISSAALVNFADPDHPATLRRFSNVTAIRMDEGRGLIYMVDKDGLWILQEKSAEDKELEEEYSRYVFYSH